MFIFLVFLSGFLEYTIYFIGTLSQTLTLRAAFASSTYLLSQIPGPGRASDDALLIPPVPLFKGAVRAFGLSIAAGLPGPPAPARHLMMPCYSSLFVVAGGFEAFGVLGYLELVDTFLDITVHEGREIVH